MSVVSNDLEHCAMAISSALHARRVLIGHDSSSRMGPRCIVKLTRDAALDLDRYGKGLI
jgi:hypothetical protein